MVDIRKIGLFQGVIPLLLSFIVLLIGFSAHDFGLNRKVRNTTPNKSFSKEGINKSKEGHAANLSHDLTKIDLLNTKVDSARIKNGQKVSGEHF